MTLLKSLLRPRFIRPAFIALLAAMATHPGQAARAPDGVEKPGKPDKKPDKRIEKIERKLERAGVVEELPPILRAAPGAAERASKAERSSRGDSGESRPGSIPADPKFEPFRLIAERNIFNPNRVGRTRAVVEEKPPRIEEISLVGTMQHDSDFVAFFHSSDAAHRKAVRVGDTIAGFTVQRVAADGVDLTRNNEPANLKVMQQLRRVEGGDWAVMPGRGPGASDAGTGTMPDAAGTAREIPPDASDVLKRLMQQRQKQLK